MASVTAGTRHTGPMGRFARSWSLVRSSWSVLRSDKELVALPAISGVVALVCTLPFLGGALLSSPDMGSTGAGADATFSMSPVGYVLMFLGYLVGAYVTIFFQAALIHAANERMSGGDPTLGSALAGAGQRAGHILPWAILSATVSVVLRSLQERAGFVGRLLIGLVGVAWTLVTFLVLPIIVVEGTGVKDALSRSGAAFKRTWGENVIGNAGIGIFGFVGMLVGLVVAGPIVALGVANDLLAVTVAGIVLAVVWLVGVSVLSAALSGVFQTALYRYAIAGETPPGFTQDQIAGAFRPKRSLSGRAR